MTQLRTVTLRTSVASLPQVIRPLPSPTSVSSVTEKIPAKGNLK